MSGACTLVQAPTPSPVQEHLHDRADFRPHVCEPHGKLCCQSSDYTRDIPSLMIKIRMADLKKRVTIVNRVPNDEHEFSSVSVFYGVWCKGVPAQQRGEVSSYIEPLY